MSKSFSCNHCGEALKYDYSWLFMILLQIFGVITGFVGAIASFIALYLLFPVKECGLRNLALPVGIGFTLILLITLIIGLGYCEGLYSRTRYRLVSVKRS